MGFKNRTKRFLQNIVENLIYTEGTEKRGKARRDN